VHVPRALDPARICLVGWLMAGCSLIVDVDGELECRGPADCDAGAACVDGVCSEGDEPTGAGDAGHPTGADGAANCVPGRTVPCGETAGACEPGVRTCRDDGTFGPCEGAVEPADERCNGTDDDCDGAIDEDVASSGEPCVGDGLGACADGVLTCADGALRCAPTLGPATEKCNGIDDDCDGATDEAGGDVALAEVASGLEAGGGSSAIAASADGTELLAVWAALGTIHARRFDAAGVPLGDATVVAEGGAPAIATTADGFYLAWADGGGLVLGRALDLELSAGPAVPLSTAQEYATSPRVAVDGDTLAYAYLRLDRPRQTFAGLVERGAEAAGGVVLESGPQVDRPDIATRRETALAAWLSDDLGVRTRGLSRDGVGAPSDLSPGPAPGGAPAVVPSAEGFVVLWPAEADEADQARLAAARFDADGASLGPAWFVPTPGLTRGRPEAVPFGDALGVVWVAEEGEALRFTDAAERSGDARASSMRIELPPTQDVAAPSLARVEGRWATLVQLTEADDGARLLLLTFESGCLTE
jgi:hypothetical protein